MDLNFKSFGQGPPLIILHGLFGTLDNWQTLAKRWAKDFSVYLIDLRNHGRSPHLDSISYPEMAEDLKSFMEKEWMYEAILLGHSMGGKVAMELALSHPDMVKKLVVVDMTPKQYPGGHEVIFKALLQMDLATIADRKAADQALTVGIPDYGVRQFLLKNLSRSKEGGYRWKMNLPVIHQHYPDILKALENGRSFEEESLFIRGAKSDYLQDNDWSMIQDYFPNAQLATVADAGHWVHADAPDALFGLVANFIQE